MYFVFFSITPQIVLYDYTVGEALLTTGNSAAIGMSGESGMILVLRHDEVVSRKISTHNASIVGAIRCVIATRDI